jgi:hypothetical protein
MASRPPGGFMGSRPSRILTSILVSQGTAPKKPGFRPAFACSMDARHKATAVRLNFSGRSA